MSVKNEYLASKPRYAILDGLRGVAALMVVVFHCFETYVPVFKTLGEISYPIYITHYPIMYMQMSWVEEHLAAPVWMHVMVNLGVLFMSVILAWGLLKAYDLPVRKWLTEHWLKKR